MATGKKIVRESTKPRFNSLDELAKVIDASKLVMFTHKAKEILVIAAKDTGKSYPVDAYKIAMMERDPQAACVTLMKHATGASKRGLRSTNNALSDLYESYDFPYKWEKSDSYMYRMYHDKREKLKNQSIEYNSFENADGLANYSTGFGGYPFLIHIEEPVLNDGKETISDNEWKNSKKTIIDTIERHHRTFYQKFKTIGTGKYFHEPIPFKIIITMNDWEPDHYESKLAEKFSPRFKFLDWSLGFEYSKLRRLWKDKIDGESVVQELKKVIDEKWEDIKISVLENHTKWVYVDKDENGIKIDKLIGRMQKFANPSLREEGESREKTYGQMYYALITGNTQDLARVFGMGNDGNDDIEKRFNLKSFTPIDTHVKLKEEGRQIIGFTVAWDHDANRGPVLTPTTYSGIRRIKNLEQDSTQVVYTDLKVMVHPQVEVEGYGKGNQGQYTKLYHEMMRDISIETINFYRKNFKWTNNASSVAVFDDDDGSYVYKMVEWLQKEGLYDYVTPLENKNGKVALGGFGTPDRDKLWQDGTDTRMIEIDEKNEKLVEWIKNVPKAHGSDGETKRDTSGKWGKRYKDISNSAEYAWWPYRYKLEYQIEEEYYV